jgi:hypothetical protein
MTFVPIDTFRHLLLGFLTDSCASHAILCISVQIVFAFVVVVLFWCSTSNQRTKSFEKKVFAFVVLFYLLLTTF